MPGSEQVHDGHAGADAFRGRQAVGAHARVTVCHPDEQIGSLVGQPTVFLQEVRVADAAEQFLDLVFGLAGEHVLPPRIEFLERLARGLADRETVDRLIQVGLAPGAEAEIGYQHIAAVGFGVEKHRMFALGAAAVTELVALEQRVDIDAEFAQQFVHLVAEQGVLEVHGSAPRQAH